MPVERADGAAYDALRDAVIADAHGICAHTLLPEGPKSEVDHAVEIRTLDIIARHAVAYVPDAHHADFFALLNKFVNSRANLRLLSEDAHIQKSNLIKKVNSLLGDALAGRSPITSAAAVNVHAGSRVSAAAMHAIVSDHRHMAYLLDCCASGVIAAGLGRVADILRAVANDEFACMWARDGEPLRAVAATKTKKKKVA